MRPARRMPGVRFVRTDGFALRLLLFDRRPHAGRIVGLNRGWLGRLVHRLVWGVPMVRLARRLIPQQVRCLSSLLLLSQVGYATAHLPQMILPFRRLSVHIHFERWQPVGPAENPRLSTFLVHPDIKVRDRRTNGLW